MVEKDESESDSDEETNRVNSLPRGHCIETCSRATEAPELMQLDMHDNTRLGSPDGGSNNLDSNFHLLTMGQPRRSAENPFPEDVAGAESVQHWPTKEPGSSGVHPLQPPMTSSHQTPHLGITFVLKLRID